MVLSAVLFSHGALRDKAFAKAPAQNFSSRQVTNGHYGLSPVHGRQGDPGAVIAVSYARYQDFQGMAVGVRVPGVLKTQLALLDTASSTLAFCDGDIARSVEHLKTNQSQCMMYGDPLECCDESQRCSSYSAEFFYGSVYHGDVQIVGGYSDRVPTTMNQVYYTVMESQSGMTCDFGFDAIFGLGFEANNNAVIVPDNEAMSLVQTCNASFPGPDNGDDSLTVGFCVTPESGVLVDRSPLLQTLDAAGEQRFGIFLDYEATKTIPNGSADNLGVLYIGPAALHNDHYRAGSPKTVSTYWRSRLGNDMTRPEVFWDFSLMGFSFIQTDLATQRNTATHITMPVNVCGPDGGLCTVDTGNPALDLPQAVCDIVFDEVASPRAGVMTLNLFANRNASNHTIGISLPIDFIVSEYVRGFVRCTADNTTTLGMPVFQHYYIVFDDKEDSITFIDRQ